MAYAIARQADIEEVGEFALAMAVFVLVNGLIRSSTTYSVLAQIGSGTRAREAAARVALVSGVCGLLTSVIGVAIEMQYLVVCGVALNGLAATDYSKTISLTLGKPSIAAFQELVWKTATIGASIACLVGIISPLSTFVAWAAAGAVVGYATASLMQFRMKPRWAIPNFNSRPGLIFGLDYLGGSGIAQVTTATVAGTAGTAVTGSLRTAATVLGPMTLVISTPEALVIKYFAARANDPPMRRLKDAIAIATVLGGLSIVFAAILVNIPRDWGLAVLGSNWLFASPLLAPLSIEFVFATLTAVAFAGLRAREASATSIAIRIAMAPARLIGITWAATAYGAVGAAWAMALVAGIGAVAYWIGFAATLKSQPV